MSSRVNLALLVSSLLSLAAIVAGVTFLSSPDCNGGGICSQSVAIVVGVPLILLGLAALAGAAFTYWADSRHGAPIACLVWACVLLGFAGAIGGAANPIGILLAMLAIVMGALSVWVTG
jgi:hypothetical protein